MGKTSLSYDIPFLAYLLLQHIGVWIPATHYYPPFISLLKTFSKNKGMLSGWASLAGEVPSRTRTWPAS